MTIIDSQVHAYEANTPKRPWHSVPNWPADAHCTDWLALCSVSASAMGFDQTGATLRVPHAI